MSQPPENSRAKMPADLVNDEIARAQRMSATRHNAKEYADDLAKLLGNDYSLRFDDFDLVQLAHVIKVCRTSDSMADAAKKLYAVSLKAKTSSNNTDRLSKYLAKFGLKFKVISLSPVLCV